MTTIESAVLDYLNGVDHGVNLTTLIPALPQYSPDDIKAATRQLYEDREINRISVWGGNGRPYYVFYSLYIRTVNIYREAPEATPAPAPEPPAPLANDGIDPEQAQRMIDVLERDLGQPERRVTERRAPRFDVMEAIDRWKLPFRLSRVIEIVGGARRRGLSRDDAALAIRMIRQHVKEEV